MSPSSSSDISAPNLIREPISDDDLIRGFLLALGAGGRKPKTIHIYKESITMLSDFARNLGLPGLVNMDRTHIRHWLTSLHQKGNKPATVSVRYRSLNRFFNWCVSEEERTDNPMDRVDPPKIPDEIQAYYQPHEVEQVVKSIGKATTHDLRDTAIIMVLYDSGVRGAELCGMKVDDLDWRDRTIIVTGKANKQRRVSIGGKAAQAIERYLRKRPVKSEWLWVGSANRSLALNGLRMVLVRRFNNAGVKFRGAHAFRRGFAMEYLAAGGQEGDLKELGGWENYAMVSRYAKANAGERAINAHKKLSPGDRLNVR
ncbi:MAG: tyrosine-type recombinase/integrase [Chloroflexi bacterium]|nr:tyrosine-type recombinase/integrase [Chloroflexota bacterium]